jgi:hypothetical protein
MKNVFCLLLLLLFCADVSAQNEYLNKNNSLAPVGGINMGVPSSSPSVYTPNVFNTNKTTSAPKSTIPEKEVDMMNKEFANPGERYVDKLNAREDRGDFKEFRKNQYFGDFKTKASVAKISCRDFGEVDGDQIKVLVNGKVMVPKIYLGGQYSTIELGLEKGFNKIEFEALNQGLLGPNTAQFLITDENGVAISSNQWNLATGFKATIILVKE